MGSFGTMVLVTIGTSDLAPWLAPWFTVRPGGRALPCLSCLWFQAWQQTVKITEWHGVCSITLPGKPHFCSTGQSK